MSFRQYDYIKDSGISWLGRIPTSWAIKKFRHLFRESAEKISNDVVGPMLSVSGYRGIEIKEYEDDNQRRLEEDLVGYRIVRKGQLVVNTMWLNYAGLGVSAFEGHVSPAYRSYWIEDGLHKPFVHHLLRSGIYVQGYTRLLTGVRPNSLQMSREDLMQFPVLCPPIDEQRTIASFLDQETSKIDVLITEQQRLIELLKEKRQAVISHAVTKGLNPDVRMKPSGVEWLGEVPEHWEVRRLGHLIRTRKGVAFKADEFTDEGTPVVKASDIKNLTVRDSSTFLPSGFEARYPKAVLTAGEIILSTVGSVPEVRNSAVGQIGKVPESLKGSLLNQNTVVFSGDTQSLHSQFLLYFLQTSRYRDHLDLHAHGTANQASLNVDDMLRCCLPLPPLDEQAQIADTLDSIISNISRLTEVALEAIELLHERRTALISAAVTGKIDVRNYASSQKDAA